MKRSTLHKILNYLIAAVWLINGLFCKVLNLVPRHREIVGRILGDDHARFLTLLIGLAEIGMTIWILSRIKSRFSAVFQIFIVATMNIIEFFLVPDLLLWGRFNCIVALMFIILVYANEFALSKPRQQN